MSPQRMYVRRSALCVGDLGQKNSSKRSTVNTVCPGVGRQPHLRRRPPTRGDRGELALMRKDACHEATLITAGWLRAGSLPDDFPKMRPSSPATSNLDASTIFHAIMKSRLARLVYRLTGAEGKRIGAVLKNGSHNVGLWRNIP